MCFVWCVGNSPVKLICFDCDSTLSAIEGIDELARLRGRECFQRVEQMTRDAMEGRIALDDIFRLRLELIKPTRAEAAAIGELYVRHVEPTALATLATLRGAGWTPVIVSGGYTQVIEPLAKFLGIARVEAVRLDFDAQGNYSGYAVGHPAARRGGKPEIVRALRAEWQAQRVVFVGDGVSDLETRDVVDLFIGFGRYAERCAVKAGAHRFVHRLEDIPAFLVP
ncbi:MAG: haloacid dehalogenase [Opitutus sp.]|nr:haloacid dehalogenase [Opitutus sp.]